LCDIVADAFGIGNWQARRREKTGSLGKSLARAAIEGRIGNHGLPKDPFLTIIDLVRITEPIMSTEATLTSKGQTTIPKLIRDSLGMKPGDRMSFTLMPDGVVIMRVKNKRMAELAGLLHKKGRKPLPIELLSR
jgi:antitoxin PrlF